jgi:ABC-type Fe3+ transport system substrate-binding protein
VQDNLLETYRVPDAILKTVGKDVGGVPIYDLQYRWYGVALASFGIISNKMLQSRLKLPEVKTWEDLANPALQMRIGTPDPRNSGSGHMIYEIVLQAYGWEKGWQILTKMGGNVKTFTAGAGDVPNEIALGNVIFGPVIDFYAYAQIAKTGSDKLGYVTPQGLSVTNADPIGILKGAPNKVTAQRFVEYCLSKDAQKLLMLPKGAAGGPKTDALARSSVLPALYGELGKKSLITSNPFLTKNAVRYDAVKGGKRWDVVNDLYGALIIDSKRELSEAWAAVAKSKNPQAEAILTKMPLTEAEALALGDKWTDDSYALTRKATISQWREFARQKYADAKKLR